MKFSIILLFYTFVSCNDPVRLIIKNESKFRFDSATIEINKYRFVIKNIAINDSSEYVYNRDSVHANHDVLYVCTFYYNDSLKLSRYHYSNDLGYIPDSLKLKITDSLTLERY
jgi:hypothetical protein